VSEEQLLEMLWDIALSDHMGDVAGAVEPLAKHFGVDGYSLEELPSKLREAGKVPDHFL
jgi:uncharacterized tellurite resistance protein B-like protein